MARRRRVLSGTGIYHVMLRGINRQDLFLDRNDFESMISALRAAQFELLPDGMVGKRNGTIYAYCLMHNHLHLLLREGKLSVSELVKVILDRFVYIYNKKYERVGHLFQGRFRSEPVEDEEYFFQLIRYIHRNPVKAMEVSRPEDYPWSSWREYLAAAPSRVIKGSDPLISHGGLCSVGPVIKKYGYDELERWVNESEAEGEDAISVLDIDSIHPPVGDEAAWKQLSEISGMQTAEAFKQLSPECQVLCIKHLMQRGVSLRQASRFSSLSYKSLWNRLNPEEYAAELAAKREERKFRKKVRD